MKTTTIAVLIFTLINLLKPTECYTQAFQVFKENGDIKVLKKSSSELVYTSKSASLAIQYAIDQVDKMEGQIELSRGLFELEEPIKIAKNNIIISGQGRGTEIRPIYKNSTAIQISNSENIKISFLTVTGRSILKAKTGIRIINTKNIIIENILCYGFSNYGLHASDGTSGIDIYRCDFTNNSKSNIFLEDITKYSTGNKIRQSIIYWGGGGVLCKNSIGLELNSNIFFQINGVPLDIECKDFAFFKNRVFLGESLDAAVKIEGQNFKINYNVITWNRGDGVLVKNSKNGEVRGNNITDHGAPPRDEIFKSGVIINNSNNIDISANAIWNWDDWTQGPMEYGIYESEDSNKNTIKYNNIHFYNKAGISSLGSGTKVENNVIDPGKDDEKPLLDFAMWRDNILNFISKDLSPDIKNDDIGEDFIIRKVKSNYKVFTSITNSLKFEHENASDAIQWAIDHSYEKGGSIKLDKGKFIINKPIIIKKNVWLKGEGEQTELYAYEIKDSLPVISIENASQTIISNLGIFNIGETNAGIGLVHSVGCKLIDLTIEGFKDYGIVFLEDTNVPPKTWGGKATSSLILIDNCKVGYNGKINIYKPDSGGYLGNAIPSLISRNIIYEGDQGIFCAGICDNIVDNILLNMDKEAIVINANSIMTTGNITYQTGGSALLDYDSKIETYHSTYDRKDNNNNKECHVTANTFIEQKGNGIEISEQWGPIVDNIIYNSADREIGKNGIWLHEYSESYTITGNEIMNGFEIAPLEYGVLEDSTAIKNVIANNIISNYRKEAILSNGIGSLVIDNSIEKYEGEHNIQKRKVNVGICSHLSHEEIKKYINEIVENIKMNKTSTNSSSSED